MILIIDSGATNSTWKLMAASGTQIIKKAKGFNVTTTPLEDFEVPIDKDWREKIEYVFFFGAGTSVQVKVKNFTAHLHSIFRKSKKIEILSDLHSAGFALSEGRNCIISIIGTGSNCAEFDKYDRVQNVNNLGYLLGDEGSGFMMGKTILNDYFYHFMPESDARLFQDTYHLDRNKLLDDVYATGKPANKYVASYCAFLSKSSKSYRNKVAKYALSQFIQKQILQFEKAKDLPIHFSGSISWYFQDIICELGQKEDLKIGSFIQNPTTGLNFEIMKKIIQIF